MGDERTRWERALPRLLDQTGCDAFLVRDTVNIRWLTGFDNVFDDEQAHALLVLPDRMILHTDSRYAVAAQAAATATDGLVEVDDARETHADFARRKLSAASVLGFEGSIAYTEFTKLAALFSGSGAADACAADTPGGGTVYVAASGPAPVPGTRLVSTDEAVLALRARKSADELSRVEAAQAITDAAFTHILGFIHAGMTEREVQRELDDFMFAQGAEQLAFPSIVAAGPHAANPHAQPDDVILESGQCVVMDFGAKVHGYCADMTRMVFVDEPPEQLVQAYAVLRAANEAVEDALVPGMTGREAHELAERVLAEGGFGDCMGHGLGHGVGLEIHEQPNLNLRNMQPLEPGNVVTVEPGIYLPGEFGMRLEDFGVVTTEGFRVITQSDHAMHIVG